jgi:hypothetical protein
MLENFLTDELTLAVAIGGEPNPLGGAQRLAYRSELGGFVATLCRVSAITPARASGVRRFNVFLNKA